MTSTYSRIMPSLPGTPKSHAERNAQAHVDEIVAAFGLHNLAGASTDIDRADIGVDMVSLIGELSWNAGDGAMALRDAIEQHCQDKPLSFRRHGYSDDLWNDSAWVTEYVEICLTTGGPALFLHVDPQDWSVSIAFQDWGTQRQYLPLSPQETEALQWFVCLLGIDA